MTVRLAVKYCILLVMQKSQLSSQDSMSLLSGVLSDTVATGAHQDSNTVSVLAVLLGAGSIFNLGFCMCVLQNID